MRATPIKILIATSDKSCQGDILDASSPLAQSAAVTCLTTSHELLESAKDQSIDVIVAAHELDDGTVFDVLEHLLKPIPVIVLVNPGEAHIALRAVKAGASDYLIIDSHGDYIKLLPDVIERTLERPKAAIAQNHQMEAIISGSNDLIVMYDREYRYVVTNDKHLEMWGYAHHELIGKHIADVLGQEFFENRAKPNLDRCFTGETIRYQTWFDFPSHGRRCLDVFSYPIRGKDNEIIGVVTNMRDRTEQVQAEAERRFHSELLQAMAEGVYCVRVSDGTIVYANHRFNEMFGYQDGELIGHPVSVINDPATANPEATVQYITKHLMEHGQWLGEVKNIRKDGTAFWCRVKIVEFNHTEYGPVWLSVQQDIDQEKRGQQSLIESERRLRALIDSQTNFVIRTDLNGKITYWNKKYNDTFGWIHGEEGIETGNVLQSIMPYHHQRTMDTVRECISTPGKVISVELDKPNQGEGIRTTLWEFVCLTNVDSTPTEMQCTGIDVTERVQAVQALKASEGRFRAVVENTRDIITLIDSNGIIEYTSPSIETILGQKPEEMVGQSILNTMQPDHITNLVNESIHPDDIAITQDGFVELMDTIGPKTPVEIRIQHKDGSWRTLEITSTNLLGDSAINGIMMNSRDITERKKAEEQLRDLNATLEQRVADRTAQLEYLKNQIEAIFNNSGDGILLLDLELTILSANQTTDELFGRSANEYLTMDLTSYLSKVDGERLIAVAEQVTLTREKQQHEMQFKRGEVYFDGEINLSPIIDMTGDVTSLVGSIRDISERKDAEKALRESERRFRTVAENYPSFFSIIEQDYSVGYTSGYEFKRAGLDPEQFIGMPIAKVFGDRFAFVKSHYERVFDGQTQMFEMQFGGQYQVYRAVPLPEDDGTIPRILAVVENITERKQAEMAVAAERNLLRTIIDTVPDFIYVQDIDGKMLLNNIAHVRSMGAQDQESVLGKTVFDLFEPELAAKFHADDQSIVKGEQSLISTLEQSVGVDGQPIWTTTTKVPLKNNEGAIIGLIGVTNNVTNLKEAELARAEERNLLKTIIDAIPFPIYAKDKELRHTLINKKLHDHYGIDVIGKTDHDLIKDTNKANAIAAVEREILEQGRVFFDIMDHVTGGKNEVWQEITKVPLYNDSGEIVGIVGVNHDITQLKQQQDELRNRERLLRESQNMLQTVLDTIPVRVFWKDLNSVFLGANKLFLQDAGLTNVSELVGTTDGHTFTNEAKLYMADDAAVIASGKPRLNYEEAQTTSKGEVIWLQTSKVPLRGLSGEIIGILGTYTDITKRKRDEELLHYLASLQEQMKDAVIGLDLEYRIKSWNAAAENMYGWTHEEVVGHPMTKFIKTTFPQGATAESTAAVLLQEGLWEGEVIQQRLDGTEMNVLASIVMNTDKEGRPIGMISVNRDITQRKLAEIALKNSEERFRLLAEKVADMISRHDLDGVYTYATPSAKYITGYEPDELIGRGAYDFFHPDDIVAIQRSHSTIIEQPVTYSVAYRFKQKSGAYVWLETTSHVVKDSETGNLVEIIAVSRDISERKKAEDQLKTLSQRLELATQAAGIGIWDGKVDGSDMYWDDRQLELYGITRDEFSDYNETWASLVHPADFEHVNQELNQAIADANKYFAEFRIIQPDGTPRHIRAIADILRDPQGVAKRIVGVNLDITEQKEAEAALRKALNRERELSALKSRFVSMASHEFRTPLASILSMAETVRVYRDRMTDDQINERFAKISNQVMYLKGVMEDVLQLERIQTGRMRFEPILNDLTRLCMDIISEFNEQPPHQGRIKYEPPSITIMAHFDAQLMRQAYSNLISNALKYSNIDKRIYVSLTANEAQTHAIFVVRDQGIGIPEDDLKELFEPFHRATNVGVIKGTGLGLAIAKRSVEAHQGTITVASTVGSGSSFTIVLPITSDKRI